MKVADEKKKTTKKERLGNNIDLQLNGRTFDHFYSMHIYRDRK